MRSVEAPKFKKRATKTDLERMYFLLGEAFSTLLAAAGSSPQYNDSFEQSSMHLLVITPGSGERTSCTCACTCK